MRQYVSPDRSKAIFKVSAMLNNPNLALQPGENLFDLFSIPYTAAQQGAAPSVSGGASAGFRVQV